MNERTGLIKLIGNILYMLLIFLFVADPTNTILGLKNVVFALLFLYNLFFFKPDWSKLVYFVIPLLAISVSWVFAIVQGNHVDMMELKGVITAFIPLLLLMWSATYDVVKLSLLPVTLTAIIVLTLFWLIFFVPDLEGIIYMFMGMHDDTIMMSNRAFLGVEIFCMYPKSTAAFLTVFGVALYHSFKGKKMRFVYIFISLVLLHMFVISGTRSSVLLPIFLLGLILLIYCRNGRYMRYVVYPGVFLFSVLFFILLAMLLMEENEASNLVKYAHLTSYKNLFNEHPEYLLLGQGPGTEFYSLGFREMTVKTEWTYLELVRNYGLMCLPILYVILKPLYDLFALSVKQESTIAVAFAYMIYLVIAGTNPLLLSSTGMVVLLSAYSYVACIKNKSENQVL